jgi:hypothetical protein
MPAFSERHRPARNSSLTQFVVRISARKLLPPVQPRAVYDNCLLHWGAHRPLLAPVHIQIGEGIARLGELGAITVCADEYDGLFKQSLIVLGVFIPSDGLLVRPLRHGLGKAPLAHANETPEVRNAIHQSLRGL